MGGETVQLARHLTMKKAQMRRLDSASTGSQTWTGKRHNYAGRSFHKLTTMAATLAYRDLVEPTARD